MAINYSDLKKTSTNVRANSIRTQITRLLLLFSWHVFPAFTRRFIFQRFFSPASHALTLPEKHALQSGKPFRIRVNGKEVRAWKWGRGPGILFAHGWNGRGVQFHPFFPSLIRAGYTVIAYDAPAHGNSEGQTTNYFELSDTVGGFLDPGLGLDLRGVVAHSLGASAVINRIAKENPDLEIVLIAPALKLKELLFDAFALHGVPEVIWRGIIADLERQYGYDLNRENPYDLVPKIRSPLLIVHDRDDRVTPFAESERLSGKLEHVTLHITEGLGHKGILKDRQVTDVITDHICREASLAHSRRRIVS